MKEVKGNDLTNSLSHIKVGSNIINTINIKENKKIMDNDDIINNKVDLKCCIMYVNNIFTFIYLQFIIYRVEKKLEYYYEIQILYF